MANFCPNCGEQLQADWRACPKCGQGVEPAAEAPAPEAPTSKPAEKQSALIVPDRARETQPLPQGATLGDRIQHAWEQATGPMVCPGCQQTRGVAGALCPACGSRYPSHRTAMIGGGVAALGGFLLLISLIATGGLLKSETEGGSGSLEGIGWLLLIVGIGMGVYGMGRAGPAQQQSCCGCSCAIAILLVPATAALLWSTGGPFLAPAAIPMWIPLSWTLDVAIRSGAFMAVWLGRLMRTVEN